MEMTKIIAVAWDMTNKSASILHMHTHTYILLFHLRSLKFCLLLFRNKWYMYILQEYRVVSRSKTNTNKVKKKEKLIVIIWLPETTNRQKQNKLTDKTKVKSENLYFFSCSILGTDFRTVHMSNLNIHVTWIEALAKQSLVAFPVELSLYACSTSVWQACK